MGRPNIATMTWLSYPYGSTMNCNERMILITLWVDDKLQQWHDYHTLWVDHKLQWEYDDHTPMGDQKLQQRYDDHASTGRPELKINVWFSYPYGSPISFNNGMIIIPLWVGHTLRWKYDCHTPYVSTINCSNGMIIIPLWVYHQFPRKYDYHATMGRP